MEPEQILARIQELKAEIKALEKSIPKTKGRLRIYNPATEKWFWRNVLIVDSFDENGQFCSYATSSDGITAIQRLGEETWVIYKEEV